jgi:hypothetical protein
VIVSRSPNQLSSIKAIVLICLCLSLSVCGKLKKTELAQPDSSNSETVTSNTPPFSTKEPPRYQAQRVITMQETSGVTTVTTTTQVARDGPNRRVESVFGNGENSIYLETPKGRYLLLPSLKIFAAVGPGLEQLETEKDLSPEKVLNEDPVQSRYQHLGGETIMGRATQKFRVTVEAGTTPQAETLVWIDESIGMPIRSETIYSDSQHSAKTTMELKDIKLEVDPKFFQLPSNYRKVTYPEVLEKLHLLRQKAN